jgi:glycosyltransferase involved in cell wall biosynthesis
MAHHCPAARSGLHRLNRENPRIMTDGFMPSVSIGMPVYNCAATLGVALRSILNQTFSNWELIVLDDGSTDKTVEIARSFKDARIRVIADGVHKGLPALLNEAISLSAGEFFARMDGDDVSYPERLALQVEYLEGHSEIDLLGGGILVFGSGGGVLGTHANPSSHEDICRRPWVGFDLAHPTWIGRIGWFRKHLYHPDSGRCCDQDLLLRTYETSRFAVLPEIVLGYREAKLSLRKILGDRCCVCESLLREAFQHRNYLVAVGGVIGQNLKGLVDIFAITTGLNYRVLRHRAMPVAESVKGRWAQVWEEVQAEEQAERRLETSA